MRLMALGAASSRSNGFSKVQSTPMAKARQLVICVDNTGYEASLERRKIYVSVGDLASEKRGLLRVIDESGEDYLYPQDMFVAAVLPASVRRAVLQAA